MSAVGKSDAVAGLAYAALLSLVTWVDRAWVAVVSERECLERARHAATRNGHRFERVEAAA